MAVYYKFKSARDYDSIPIEGQFISVANLKERIFESKHLGRGTDFDLMISNAQTDEEYADEATMIPKNTSVLIRRIPGRPRKPIVTEPEETKAMEGRVEETMPSGSAFLADASMKYPEESEWDDEFGNDLYVSDSVPSQLGSQAVDASENKVDEDSKIKALIDTSALDYSQIPDGYGGGRGYGRGMGGRMMGGRGFGRGGLERRTPPAGYVCHRCKVPGHFIQHCPTNGDARFDMKRMKPPTGIPKSMLMATPDGSYALPSGAGAVLKPNEAAFEKEIEGLPTTRSLGDLPPELRCPLCKEVMKDAVLTSKCCFRSFCDKCIRDYIINKSMCVCGATSILADDLLPNKTLRETISRILEAPPTSSTENVGSMVQVQDMESAIPVQPKVRSPAVSAASKEEPKRTPAPVEESPDVESHSEVKTTNVDMSSSDKKVPALPDVVEGTMESKILKEKTPEATPVVKESQEKMPVVGEQVVKKKKKKKVRAPGNAEDWKPYQDFGAENFAGMPMGPAGGFNPYWGGGMPLPMDYMGAPFPGPMPYMGYPPGPFDPFGGGVLPQDPFMPPGYMMPAVPRDLSELAVNSMGMNMGPPVVSRDEFELRKPDNRRRREMERFNERGQGRRSRRTGRRRHRRRAPTATPGAPRTAPPAPARSAPPPTATTTCPSRRLRRPRRATRRPSTPTRRRRPTRGPRPRAASSPASASPAATATLPTPSAAAGPPPTSPRRPLLPPPRKQLPLWRRTTTAATTAATTVRRPPRRKRGGGPRPETTTARRRRTTRARRSSISSGAPRRRPGGSGSIRRRRRSRGGPGSAAAAAATATTTTTMAVAAATSAGES